MSNQSNSIETVFENLQKAVVAAETNLTECMKRSEDKQPCADCRNLYLSTYGTYFMLTAQSEMGEDHISSKLEEFTQVVVGLVKSYSDKEDKQMLKELKKKAKSLNMTVELPAVEED